MSTPDQILYRVNNLLSELNKDSVKQSGCVTLDEFRVADLEAVLAFVRNLPTYRAHALTYRHPIDSSSRPTERLYSSPARLGQAVEELARSGYEVKVYRRDYFVGLEQFS